MNMTTNTVSFLVVRDIFFTSNIYDNFRIITAAAAVTEPTALALAGCGFAVIIARRKPRRLPLQLSTTISPSAHSPKRRFTS